MISSFEFDPRHPADTIDLTVNGKKHGKWIVKKDGTSDTLYYRNDTLVTN